MRALNCPSLPSGRLSDHLCSSSPWNSPGLPGKVLFPPCPEAHGCNHPVGQKCRLYNLSTDFLPMVGRKRACAAWLAGHRRSASQRSRSKTLILTFLPYCHQDILNWAFLGCYSSSVHETLLSASRISVYKTQGLSYRWPPHGWWGQDQHNYSERISGAMYCNKIPPRSIPEVILHSQQLILWL